MQVTTSGTTRVTLAKTVAVAAIAKGDRIFVTGAASGTTVTATRITDLGDATRALPAGGANGPPGDGEGRAGLGARGGANRVGGNAGGGFTAGTVASVGGGTIVVTTAGGTSTTVKTTATTVVTKDVEGTVSALKPGDTVRVIGTTSGNGSVTATAITEGAGGFGGFAGGGFGGRNRTPGSTAAGA